MSQATKPLSTLSDVPPCPCTDKARPLIGHLSERKEKKGLRCSCLFLFFRVRGLLVFFLLFASSQLRSSVSVDGHVCTSVSTALFRLSSARSFAVSLSLSARVCTSVEVRHLYGGRQSDQSISAPVHVWLCGVPLSLCLFRSTTRNLSVCPCLRLSLSVRLTSRAGIQASTIPSQSAGRSVSVERAMRV